VSVSPPPGGAGVRVDAGIRSGQDISPHYDPMVAKIIASGPSREAARRRLVEALRDTVLFGTRHNRDFLVACLEKQAFVEGAATTAFIDEEFTPGELADSVPALADSAVAAVLELTLEHAALHAQSVIVAPQLRDWSSADPLCSRKRYAHGDCVHDLAISPQGASRYRVRDGDEAVDIELLEIADSSARLRVDGRQQLARFLRPAPGSLHLSIDGRAAVYTDSIRLDGADDSATGDGSVTAPMHGLLLELRVARGDEVTAGQTLAVLEAMKMHYEIVAEAAGTVREVTASAGAQVAADELLLEIDVAG